MFIVPEQNADGPAHPGWVRKRLFIAANPDFLLLAQVSTRGENGASDTECIWGFWKADDLDALIRGILQGNGKTTVKSISIAIPQGKSGSPYLTTEAITKIHEKIFIKSYKAPEKQYVFYTETGTIYYSDNKEHSGIDFGRDVYISKKHEYA
jgi:hypothetical protein